MIGLICERVTKGHRIEVSVSKSSVEIKNTAYTPVLFLILLAVHLMKYCYAIWNNLLDYEIFCLGGKMWNKINPSYAAAYFIATAIS